MIPLLLTALSAALLAAIVLSGRQAQKLHFYLVCLVIVQVATAVTSLDNTPYPLGHANLSTILLHSYFLTGPLLYLYTYSLTGFKALQLWQKLLHFLPWPIISAFFLFAPPAVDSSRPHRWWQQVEFSQSPELLTPWILALAFVVSACTYSCLSLRIIRCSTKRLQLEYSNHAAVSLTWLKLLCVIIFLQAIMVLMILVIAPVVGIDFFSGFIRELAVGSSLLLLLSIVFYGFKQPVVFHPELSKELLYSRVKDDPLSLNDMDSSTTKSEQIYQAEEQRHLEPEPENKSVNEQRLTDEQAAVLFDALNLALAHQRLFLNPNLKLSDLATALGVSLKDASFVINHCAKQNFYEYLNRFRIEFAKSFAQGRAREGITTTPADMAYESGFNSNSTFYKHFRKFAGTTPRAYINQLSA